VIRRFGTYRSELRELANWLRAYQMLKHNEPYRELGENYFDQINPEKTATRLIRRLQKMGYQVSITKSPKEIPCAP
jgi:hypothetical protein